MKEVVIVFILCWFISSLANSGSAVDKKQIEKALEGIREIDRFIEYIEQNKERLPRDIKQRYDELKSYFDKQKTK